jgi:hypothetical protein
MIILIRSWSYPFCEINAHRNPMKLWGSGPWMSPNYTNSYGLVTALAHKLYKVHRVSMGVYFADTGDPPTPWPDLPPPIPCPPPSAQPPSPLVGKGGGGRGGGGQARQPATMHKESYSMLGTHASGSDSGLPRRISAGFSSGTPQNRPSRRPSAGLRPAGGPILRLSRLGTGRNPLWKIRTCPRKLPKLNETQE